MSRRFSEVISLVLITCLLVLAAGCFSGDLYVDDGGGGGNGNDGDNMANGDKGIVKKLASRRV